MASIIAINPREKSNTILLPSKIKITNQLFVPKGKNPNRQVSLITLEGENRLREDMIKGFCHGRFKADLVIEGFSTADIKLRDIMTIGTAKIEVTDVGKECYGDCPACKDGGSCGVNEFIIYGRIIEEGNVKIGDRIKFQK